MKGNAGFSIIEVLCAILIMGVGVTGLTVGITTALRSSKESERQTQAALIAAGEIETLIADGYVVAGEDEGDCGEGLSQYRWRQSIVETQTEGLYEVKVTVELSETGETIYALQTMLFDPPVYSQADEDEKRKKDDTDTLRHPRRSP